MSRGSAPRIGERGVEHRYGCGMSGWDSRPASVPGFYVPTCPGCGVVRIVRTGSAKAARAGEFR